jgi:photosystem II stability/assembly factor-like uncharacterized protein
MRKVNRLPKFQAALMIAVLMGLFLAAIATPGFCQVVWESVGPEGGDINVITVDPLQTETLFIAVEANRIYRSDDFGTSWSPFGNGLPDIDVTDIVIDRTVAPGVLYAGTAGAGVFRRTEPGVAWQAVNTGLTNPNIEALVLDPTNPNTVFAGTTAGVFLTQDAGATWIPRNGAGNVLAGVRVTALAADVAFASFFAGTAGSGAFRTDDAGATWTPINVGLPNVAILTITTLAVDPTNPTTVLLGTADQGIFISLDRGGTWAAFNEGLTTFATSNIREIVVEPTQDAFFAATEDGVFRRFSGGPSWTLLSSGLSARFTEAVAFDPLAPNTLYAGTVFYGVFKSTDAGATWARSNTGLIATRIRAVKVDPQSSLIAHAAGFGGGVLTSAIGGTTPTAWAPSGLDIDETLAVALAIDPADSNTVYVGTEDRGILISGDRAASWNDFNQGLPANSAVTAILIDPSNSSVLYAVVPGTGVFKRQLPGVWTLASTGLPSPVIVTDLAINPANTQVLLATTDGDGVFRTANAAATWTPVNTGLTTFFLLSVSIDPLRTAIAYVGGSGARIFRSTDGGVTWAVSGVGLPSAPDVEDIVITRETPPVIYAGLFGDGVFRSLNEGGAWSSFNANLTNFFINALEIDPRDPLTVFAATEAGGIFRATNDATVIPGGDGGGGSASCFIATAAFGTPFAEEVNVLREFRDRRLLTNLAGRAFVKAYYRLSPPVAGLIAANPWLGSLTRACLRPVVLLCRVWLDYPTQSAFLLWSILGFGIATLAFRHSRARGARSEAV